jgi:SAM-dependent methyltransferase
MSRYALLILPSANRVYGESAVALTQAELTIVGDAVLAGRIGEVTRTDLAGVPYVTFSADRLGDRDLGFLANLSSLYALFELDGELLRPLRVQPLDRYDDDLVTIQKYPGKTNEQFTKLLLNVTLMASARCAEMLDRRFTVLDPLCGRGTTLNQAAMYGFDASGIDLDPRDFEAYATFLSTWLKRKRIKHQVEAGALRRNRQTVARRLEAVFAPSKQEYGAGRTQQIEVLNADTTRAGEFFRRGSFDLVVGDAPYGVQHGSRTAAKGLARSPLALLAEAAPVWAELLRPGGALGLAWNVNVAERAEAATILADAGLEPVDSDPYLHLRHRVDQAILRDVIVAGKP